MDELLKALGEFIEAVRAGGPTVEAGMQSVNLYEPFERLVERYEAVKAEPAPATSDVPQPARPTYTYN